MILLFIPRIEILVIVVFSILVFFDGKKVQTLPPDQTVKSCDEEGNADLEECG
jgi:hypothetical protein